MRRIHMQICRHRRKWFFIDVKFIGCISNETMILSPISFTNRDDFFNQLFSSNCSFYVSLHEGWRLRPLNLVSKSMAQQSSQKRAHDFKIRSRLSEMGVSLVFIWAWKFISMVYICLNSEQRTQYAKLKFNYRFFEHRLFSRTHTHYREIQQQQSEV